jgi:hypothetical protein
VGRNKKLRKQIQGEVGAINEHLDKIAMELLKANPSRLDIQKWELDIARHQRLLARLSARLPGRRRR